MTPNAEASRVERRVAFTDCRYLARHYNAVDAS